MSKEYIKDPLERIEDNINYMIDNWDGKSCMSCGKIPGHELVALNSNPDSPAVCKDCAEEAWNKRHSGGE